MKHFSMNEWTLFSQNLLDDDTKEAMEDHLFGCESCLEVYLSAVEALDLENAAVLISPGFADAVMEQLGNENIYKKAAAGTRRLPNIFIYYTAAACITLLLTFSGVFQSMVNGVPGTTSFITDSRVNAQRVFTSGWTERLTNKAVIFMDEFKPKNYKE